MKLQLDELTGWNGEERRNFVRKTINPDDPNEFKSVKVLKDDHWRIKRLAFEHDIKNYEVVTLALNRLERSFDSDQDANHPLFQSSAK